MAQLDMKLVTFRASLTSPTWSGTVLQVFEARLRVIVFATSAFHSMLALAFGVLPAKLFLLAFGWGLAGINTSRLLRFLVDLV